MREKIKGYRERFPILGDAEEGCGFGGDPLAGGQHPSQVEDDGADHDPTVVVGGSGSPGAGAAGVGEAVA